MESRRILSAASPLGLLLDTYSLDGLLEAGDNTARRLLEYQHVPHFEYSRSPASCRSRDLQLVNPYVINGQLSDASVSVTIAQDGGTTTAALPGGPGALQVLSERLGEPLPCGDSRGHIACLPMVAGALSDRERRVVIVTADPRVLRNRDWIDSFLSDVPIDIATPEEALEIMDLFAKRLGKFHISNNCYCSKGHWYWLSLRSRMPHFQVDDGIRESLSTRVTHLLMSIDEIGQQYYLGADNDTMRGSLYHFYYFVVLACGTLDSLAVEANEQYRLGFEVTPHKISLRNDVGREFLRAMRAKNAELRTHVSSHAQLVKLLFLMRHGIIHRQLPQETSYQWADHDGQFEANFLWLDCEVLRLAEGCGDKPLPFDRVSEWGLYEFSGEVFLEPYRFAKRVGSELLAFVDEYLRLLGLSNWLGETGDSDAADELRSEIKLFRECRMGY